MTTNERAPRPRPTHGRAMRWRTRFVCTAMPIARPIASPHRRSASCTRSTPVAPPPWADISSALPTAASNVPPTTPAAITIVPSVNRSRRPGGLRLGRRSCCPSTTFTPSSPCPTISTRSSLRTRPSSIRSLENGSPDPDARRVLGLVGRPGTEANGLMPSVVTWGVLRRPVSGDLPKCGKRLRPAGSVRFVDVGAALSDSPRQFPRQRPSTAPPRTSRARDGGWLVLPAVSATRADGPRNGAPRPGSACTGHRARAGDGFSDSRPSSAYRTPRSRCARTSSR